MFHDVKHIVSNVRRMHKQQHLSKKLIAYAETRFSGAYNMLAVFLETFSELTCILDSKLFSHYAKIDKDFLDDVCKFLLPFDTVLQALSDSKRPTLHRVLPFKQFLINKCTIQDDDKEGLKQIKSFLSMYLKTTYTHLFTFCHFIGKRLEEKWTLSNEHLIATLVHPNLKHFRMCPFLKERALFLLKQEMMKRQPNESSSYASTVSDSSIVATSSTSSVLTSSSISYSSLSASALHPVCSRKSLLFEIFDKENPQREKTKIDEEIEKYLASTSAIESEEEDDVLSYWREHYTLFPTISAIARDVLAIPASNTCVERLFSACKNTLTNKRTRMAGEKLNKIMFLQRNMNVLKEYSLNVTRTSDDQPIKRKYDDSSDHYMKKTSRTNDRGVSQENDSQHPLYIESENDE